MNLIFLPLLSQPALQPSCISQPSSLAVERQVLRIPLKRLTSSEQGRNYLIAQAAMAKANCNTAGKHNCTIIPPSTPSSLMPHSLGYASQTPGLKNSSRPRCEWHVNGAHVQEIMPSLYSSPASASAYPSPPLLDFPALRAILSLLNALLKLTPLSHSWWHPRCQLPCCPQALPPTSPIPFCLRPFQL